MSVPVRTTSLTGASATSSGLILWEAIPDQPGTKFPSSRPTMRASRLRLAKMLDTTGTCDPSTDVNRSAGGYGSRSSSTA